MRYLLLALPTITLVIGCATPEDPYYPPLNSVLEVVSQTQTPGWALDVDVYQNLAYVADDDQGISIYDVSNSTAPVRQGGFATLASADLVKLFPEFGLIMVSEDRVGCYDWNDYRFLFNSWDSGVRDIAAAIIDSLNFLLTDVQSEGFQTKIWRFNPILESWGNPKSLNESPEPYYVGFEGLDLDLPYAFLARGQYGFEVHLLDFLQSGGDTITTVGRVDTPGSALRVALVPGKDLAVVADYQGGLQVIDISDKSTPAIVGSLIPPGVDRVIRVTVDGDTVYFIDQYDDIYAADISNPSAPRLIARVTLPEPTGVVVGDNGLVYVSDRDLGLVILRWRN